MWNARTVLHLALAFALVGMVTVRWPAHAQVLAFLAVWLLFIATHADLDED